MRHYTCILILISLLIFSSSNAQDSVSVKRGYTKLYYPDGRISSEGVLINGQPDGYWKNYYQNGNLKSEGNRKSGNVDSLWKFYNEEGILKTSIDYKEGKKSGLRVQFDEKENVLIKEAFIADKKNGFSYQYFPSGSPKYMIAFLDGKEEGRGVEYDESGNVIVLLDYKNGVLMRQQRVNRYDKLNRKAGNWVEINHDFSIKKETQYSENLKNGYLKEYDQRGSLVKIEKYVDDVLQLNAAEISPPKIRREFYKGARIKKEGPFTKDGTPVGMHVSYDSSGNVISAEEFQGGFVAGRGIVDNDGLKQGRWEEFYATGEKKAEGAYKDDRKIDTWKYFHQNGQTEQTGTYIKGKPAGVWKWFYESGNLLMEMDYLSGREDGFSYELSEAGDTIAKGEYVEGEREGKWSFRQGNQSISGYFKAGELSGEWKHVYPNGKLSYAGKFEAGLPEGRHQSFYEDGTLKWEGKHVAGKREGAWRSYSSDGLLFLTIEYQGGIEVKYDGVKIKPEFEPADFENLLEINPYTF